MVAGTKTAASSKNGSKAVMDEIPPFEERDSFIDELHTIVGQVRLKAQWTHRTLSSPR